MGLMGLWTLRGIPKCASHFKKCFHTCIQRYEKKYGRDEAKGKPRCLVAAKFISAHDVTGEKTLQHWIAQGQIQDLLQVFRRTFQTFKTLGP